MFLWLELPFHHISVCLSVGIQCLIPRILRELGSCVRVDDGLRDRPQSVVFVHCVAVRVVFLYALNQLACTNQRKPAQLFTDTFVQQEVDRGIFGCDFRCVCTFADYIDRVCSSLRIVLHQTRFSQ